MHKLRGMITSMRGGRRAPLEPSYLSWCSGKIAVSQGGARSGVLKEPAVLLPFAQISLLITETKESVYQKGR